MAEFDDDMILEHLRDLLRNRPTGSRSGPRSKPDEFKISELPEFVGGTNPEDYLEWERRIDRLFDFKDLSDEKRCKYALLKLSKGASLWFEGLKAKRARAGKDKVASWESLKHKLRKRYVPTTHRITTYRKIAEFKQGKLSVGEYIDEFENLSLMGEVEEIEEQKMSRFLRGLNYNIANVVELYPYSDFDTLCGLCLKLESQGRSKYGNSGGDYNKSGSGHENDSSSKQNPSSNSTLSDPKIGHSPVSYSTSKASFKPSDSHKETSLSRVRCFKCQGFGHYQSACPNKRVVTLREAIEMREEAEKDETLGGVFNLNEVEEENLDVVAYEAPNYDVSLVIRTLQVQADSIRPETEQRDQLFHTKCQVNDRWCSVIIDGGSCTNAASSEMVSKLALQTTAHPEPYALHWLNDGKKVQVSKQVRICFTMGSYGDEVLCDVVPMDACHVLLGRPWQYDQDVTHMGRSNEYTLFSKGKKVVLKPMSSQAVRAMYSGRKRSPSLSMLAMVGKREFGLDFNQSPVFDEYTDYEECDAKAKEPCPSYDSGQKFEVVADPITHTINASEFLVRQCYYLINFRAPKAAATVISSGCSMGFIRDEVRDKVTMFVHGGRWGGRHKDTLKSSERCSHVTKMQLELRSIPSEEGGDDASNGSDLATQGSLANNLFLAVEVEAHSPSSKARYVCLLSCIGSI